MPFSNTVRSAFSAIDLLPGALKLGRSNRGIQVGSSLSQPLPHALLGISSCASLFDLVRVSTCERIPGKIRTPPMYKFYTSRIGSYGRLSLGDLSDLCGLDELCEVVSKWVEPCICTPEVTVIPLIISPSAKR